VFAVAAIAKGASGRAARGATLRPWTGIARDASSAADLLELSGASKLRTLADGIDAVAVSGRVGTARGIDPAAPLSGAEWAADFASLSDLSAGLARGSGNLADGGAAQASAVSRPRAASASMSRVSDTGTDLSAAALPAGDFRNSSSAGKIEEFLMRGR